MKYVVTQMLVRERVIEVEAGERSEALRLVREGHGQQVSSPRAPLHLLSESAVRATPHYEAQKEQA